MTNKAIKNVAWKRFSPALFDDFHIVLAMPEGTSIDLQNLVAQIQKLEAKIAESGAWIAATEAKIARVNYVLAAVQQKLYRRKSERLSYSQIGYYLEDGVMGLPCRTGT